MNAKAAFIPKFQRNLKSAESVRGNEEKMNAKAAFIPKFQRNLRSAESMRGNEEKMNAKFVHDLKIRGEI